MTTKRSEFRYRVTKVFARFKDQLKPGDVVVSPRHRGRVYTWQFAKLGGQPRPGFTGVYLGDEAKPTKAEKEVG